MGDDLFRDAFIVVGLVGLTWPIEQTRFIVTAWPDNRWPVELVHWIELLCADVDVRPDNRISLNVLDRTCARNRGIRAAMQSPAHYSRFIFIDHDVRPARSPKFRETSEFLQLGADVVCCQVPLKNRMAWSKPTSFHDPLWATSRDVLEQLSAPWFLQEYSEDGCRQVGCICKSFERQLLDMGISIAHGGHADHDMDRSWC